MACMLQRKRCLTFGNKVDRFYFNEGLASVVELFAIRVSWKELDIQKEEKVVQDAAKVLLSALDLINVRRSRMAFDALRGFPSMGMLPAHIIHIHSMPNQFKHHFHYEKRKGLLVSPWSNKWQGRFLTTGGERVLALYCVEAVMTIEMSLI